MVAPGTVFAVKVEPELISVHAAHEVALVGEGFNVEELFFYGVVRTFNIGVGVWASGGIEAMQRAVAFDGAVKAVRVVMNGFAVMLRAKIRADLHLGSVYAVAAKVFEEAFNGARGVGF